MIDRIDGNDCKEGIAKAKRPKLEGRGFETQCWQFIFYREISAHFLLRQVCMYTFSCLGIGTSK